MIPEYVPFTPLNADTFYGHLLFGLSFTRVRTTIARGRVIVDEGALPHLDEEAVRARCRERAARLERSMPITRPDNDLRSNVTATVSSTGTGMGLRSSNVRLRGSNACVHGVETSVPSSATV